MKFDHIKTYVFAHEVKFILSYSTRQLLIDTYSNQVKILETYKASDSVQKRCVIFFQMEVTVLYEDDTSCISQLKV